MERYIILGNFTRDGLKKIEKFPNKDNAARNLIEKSGGKLQIYYTMGLYDFVALVDMPDEKSMIKLLFRMGKVGDVKTNTLRAYTESEFHKLLEQLYD
jgi:uncharacterized protein with GYD domain